MFVHYNHFWGYSAVCCNVESCALLVFRAPFKVYFFTSKAEKCLGFGNLRNFLSQYELVQTLLSREDFLNRARTTEVHLGLIKGSCVVPNYGL